MRICEYCGNADNTDTPVCPSCGGNSFAYRCDNCGTDFNTGNYCPKCGVKAGQAAKICPRCRAKYYSPACPTCGYIPTQQSAPAPVYVGAWQPSAAPKRKNTVWWVLLWIFLPYVAGTALTLRSKRLPTWAKVLLLILIWGLVAIAV